MRPPRRGSTSTRKGTEGKYLGRGSIAYADGTGIAYQNGKQVVLLSREMASISIPLAYQPGRIWRTGLDQYTGQAKAADEQDEKEGTEGGDLSFEGIGMAITDQNEGCLMGQANNLQVVCAGRGEERSHRSFASGRSAMGTYWRRTMLSVLVLLPTANTAR